MDSNSTEQAPVATDGRHRERLIMVAVDNSQQALWAAKAASRLAEDLSASVVLVHVMNTAAAAATELAFTERELLAMLRQRAEAAFESAAKQFPPAVQVQRLLREGDAGREIVASAREWGADLVVIGTHARGRLATLLLGSTAEAVIRGAPCPVLTVAHNPVGAAAPPSGSELTGVPAIAV